MALRHPEIIRDGAEAFGRQCIVLSTQVKRVEARPGIPSGYEVFIDGAREATGLDALEWVRRGAELGAGQSVVNSSAPAAIISSILSSPRFDRNLGVRELKAWLVELGVPLRPYLDASSADAN